MHIFYLKRSKGFTRNEKLDMKMVDLGIALCQFSLTAKENGLNIKFIQDEPKFLSNSEVEYIASYTLI